MQDTCRICRNRVVTGPDCVQRRQLSDMNGNMSYLEHIGRTQDVPGIHYAIVPECDLHSCRHEFRHPGHPSAFWIRIMPPLERDIDKGIRDRGYARFSNEG